VPTAVGLIFGLGILFVSWIISFKRTRENASFGHVMLVTFLVIGFLLSPTLILGGGYQNYDCGGDVLASYDQLGEYLAGEIPPGSLVYWQGGLSPAPLLYISDVQIFAPQLNQDYSFKLSGDPDALYKYGFWNQELAEEWLAETDYALIVTRYYKNWVRDIVSNEDQYELVGKAPPTVQCEPDAYIRVFRRIP
jgi:hypothetical protein